MDFPSGEGFQFVVEEQQARHAGARYHSCEEEVVSEVTGFFFFLAVLSAVLLVPGVHQSVDLPIDFLSILLVDDHDACAKGAVSPQGDESVPFT